MEQVDEFLMQIIDELPSMTEAIRCCIRLARLTDKQVYLEMGIDSGTWARIMHGTSHFPHEKLVDLISICRNPLPLAWLAKQCGYELKLAKSSYEEKLEKKQNEIDSLKQQLEGIVQLLKAAKIEV